MSADTNPQSEEFNLSTYFQIGTADEEVLYATIARAGLEALFMAEAYIETEKGNEESATEAIKKARQLIQKDHHVSLGNFESDKGLFKSIEAELTVLPPLETLRPTYGFNVNATYLHPEINGLWTDAELLELKEYLARVSGEQNIHHYDVNGANWFRIDDQEEETRSVIAIVKGASDNTGWIYISTNHISYELFGIGTRCIPLKDQVDFSRKLHKFGNLTEIVVNGMAKIKGIPQVGSLTLKSPTNLQ